MKSKIKNLSFALLIVSVFTGCVKDLTQTVYSGEALVEVAPTIARTLTVTTGVPLRDSILVQLVAPQRTTATNVNYSIGAASTALPAEYTVLTASPVAIAPATSSTWIKFVFTKPPAQRTLVVTLTGGDNVKPSVNFQTFTYTIR